MPLLSVQNIHTFYDLSHILFGASFNVNEREVTFLLGRNGAGKTTTLRTIMGMPGPKSGSVKFRGAEIAGLPTHKIARLGLTLVPEGRRVLAGLTVNENLIIASSVRKAAKTWTLERVYDLFPILRSRMNQEAVTLSGGEQQMLAIGRGLMSSPHLLLIDEPVEGLAPLITRAVLNVLIQLKKEGTSMFCVDDDTKLSGQTADVIFFMEQGKIVWTGSPGDALKNDQEIAKGFLAIG